MILVTGATGNLGTAVLSSLRRRGATATGSSSRLLPGMRQLDFDQPEDLDLRAVQTLVLVSAGYAEDDTVIARHRAVIDGAVRDGVEHVVYTSLTAAGDHLGFALAHRVTERHLARSGLRWTVLRNGLYAELFGALLTWGPGGLESAFGTGALAAVARDDLAEAAAVVAVAAHDHVGRTYDLVGRPIAAGDVAARLGVPHQSISLSEYRGRLLEAAGLLPFQPSMLVSIASAVRHDLLCAGGDDLARLLGRQGSDPLDVAVAVTDSTRRDYSAVAASRS